MPGKVLKPLFGDVSMLEYLVNKCRPYPFVVAIPQSDHTLADALWRMGAPCFKGSENDVLGRMIGAAESNNYETIIRVTADNPFTMIAHFWGLTQKMQSLKWDYMTPYMDAKPAPQHGSGVFPEAVKLEALKRLNGFADGKDREHVTLGIYTRREIFRILPVHKRRDADLLRGRRFTVDTPEDLQRARALFENNPPGFDRDVESLCRAK